MLDNPATIVVRVDANRQMGIGHAMRCLAVSEQLINRGYRVIFAMHEVPSGLLARLDRSGIEVLRLSEAENTPQGFDTIRAREKAQYVLLDGYHLQNTYEKTLTGSDIRSLRFDDYMPGSCCNADVVVNASPHADAGVYRKWAPKATLLLGARHIAFRSDMINAHKAQASAKAALAADGPAQNTNTVGDSILINFGGSDHLDMTLRVASQVASLLPDAQIEAVTGAAYPNPERLQNLGIKNLIHHHNTDNLADIMQRARIAISAGGLTVTELALFQIPTILAITAQNQLKGAHVSWCHTILPSGTNGAIDTDGMLAQIVFETKRLWHLPEERTAITQRIPAELDVLGAERIANALMGQTADKQG